MRIRSAERYEEKYEYVRWSPVRLGLVEKEEWPHQTRIAARQEPRRLASRSASHINTVDVATGLTEGRGARLGRVPIHEESTVTSFSGYRHVLGNRLQSDRQPFTLRSAAYPSSRVASDFYPA